MRPGFNSQHPDQPNQSARPKSMRLKIQNFQGNILSAFRSCGYVFLERSGDDEWNFARKITGANYPRFHCYAKKENGNLLINLHLDQKKPSYEGSARHSGEYDGPAITSETTRITRQIALENR